MAMVVSWVEEKAGEDGMELSAEESSDEIDEPGTKRGDFILETTVDPDFVDPKHGLFQIWKWYTILF